MTAPSRMRQALIGASQTALISAVFLIPPLSDLNTYVIIAFQVLVAAAFGYLPTGLLAIDIERSNWIPNGDTIVGFLSWLISALVWWLFSDNSWQLGTYQFLMADGGLDLFDQVVLGLLNLAVIFGYVRILIYLMLRKSLDEEFLRPARAVLGLFWFPVKATAAFWSVVLGSV